LKYQLVSNTIPASTKKYFNIVEKATDRALAAGGLQLLNNIVNGSPAAAAIPPKLTGHLRGSGSVFVGSKFIGDSSMFEAGGKPNKKLYRKDPKEINVGFDTPYAAKMNEEIGVTLKLGPVSLQSGNVEAHFMQKHITGDSGEIIRLVADITKKDTGK